MNQSMSAGRATLEAVRLMTQSDVSGRDAHEPGVFGTDEFDDGVGGRRRADVVLVADNAQYRAGDVGQVDEAVANRGAAGEEGVVAGEGAGEVGEAGAGKRDV